MVFSLLLFFFFFTFGSIFLQFSCSINNIKVMVRKLVPSNIECLILFYKNRDRLLNWYTELLSQSATQTIVVHRIGALRTIVTANPVNVEYILKTNFANFPKGKPFTQLLGDFLGLGIFNVDGEQWSIQRKLASHVFSARSLREFVVQVLQDEVQTRLLPILETAVQNDTVLDMQEVLRRFAFDTICQVSLGMDPTCLLMDDLSKPPPPLAAAFDAASKSSAMRGAAPIPAVWKCKRALNLGSEKDLKQAVKLIHECVDDIIKSKREAMIFLINNNDHDHNDDGDLLTRFLAAGVDDEIVRDMVISFLMAGRDTTSAALTWFFWLLSSHREIEKRVVDEIISIKKNYNKSEGGRMLINFEDMKQHMDYTKACLCESMRLYPPVVWDSKHALKDDVLPDGTPVYKGNRVTYFQYGMGRMVELWGEDRFEFNPDRWFDDIGSLKMVSPYKFPVFQAGPRVCLGKEMAFIQMKYVVASVLSRFELMPVNVNCNSDDEPGLVPLLTAHMAGGFNVRVRNRSTTYT